jgi:hypothetical protein
MKKTKQVGEVCVPANTRGKAEMQHQHQHLPQSPHPVGLTRRLGSVAH